ncbi:uncharacterized protein LOC132267541 [Cornus florida]|uniref:uncharacterized protein LOC132267541 n=1 Tax=Cornus florida TaxID=4283 RepID=UPI0028A0CAA9|nr:uncharacterized protein LOC132267541 [Cornus florida]
MAVEDDDVDINPFTMLLIPDDQDDHTEPSSTLQSDAPNQQLQHHYIHSIQSTVLIRQIKSQGISFQLWPAATTLVSLLDRHRADPSSGPLTSLGGQGRRRRLRILELGSGTGLVGISAAAILGADVTVTDLTHVLPNLRFNADANADVLARHGGAVEVAALGWGEADQMERVGREFDLILGSDVVYHEHLFDPLIKTLGFLLVEGEEEVVFVMGHLRRWKKESVFFKKAKKLFDVEVIHSDDPTNGARVGVVVYRFARKKGKSLNGVVR